MTGKLALAGRMIVVRDWIAEDLPHYREEMRPGREWQALDGPYYARPSEEATEQLLAKVAKRIEGGDWPTPRLVAAVADASTNRLVGRVSRYWQSEETQWLSAGIVIFDSEKWGRGLGYEALGLWSQYLFDSLKDIVRLDLRTWSGNPGMMRLAEKLGYREEARFRKARIVDGEYYDGMAYGVLREEWERSHPGGFAQSL